MLKTINDARTGNLIRTSCSLYKCIIAYTSNKRPCPLKKSHWIRKSFRSFLPATRGHVIRKQDRWPGWTISHAEESTAVNGSATKPSRHCVHQAAATEGQKSRQLIKRGEEPCRGLAREMTDEKAGAAIPRFDERRFRFVSPRNSVTDGKTGQPGRTDGPRCNYRTRRENTGRVAIVNQPYGGYGSEANDGDRAIDDEEQASLPRAPANFVSFPREITRACQPIIVSQDYWKRVSWRACPLSG